MPIINNVAMAADSAAHASSTNMRRTVDELLSDNIAADRREQLHRFLGMARQQSDEENADITISLHRASQQLNHVVDILKDQEKYAYAEPILENVSVADLLREAIEIIPEDDDPVVEIDINGVASDCMVRAHRAGLLQVFNNILLNAYESIARKETSHGIISISTSITGECEDERFDITVCDSGAGIEPATLDDIFDRGYTSKGNDSIGLGLHWSANALASMRGQISAHSKGSGRGAEFRISLIAA